MQSPHTLSKTTLVDLILQLQKILYQDVNPEGRKVWNPDKEHDSQELGEINNLMSEYDLVPDETK